MNKKISLLLAVIYILSLSAMTACSDNTQPDTEIEKVVVNLAAGDKKGTCYSFAMAMAEKMEEVMETVDFKVKSTDSAKDSLERVAGDEMQMAMIQGDILDYAYNETNFFEDVSIAGFSAVSGCYTQACQLIVGADTEIESVADLTGKRISAGVEGSSAELNAEQILGAYGLSDENVNIEYLSFADSALALKNGEIDGFFFTAGAPATAVLEIATQKNIRLINISGKEAKQLIEQYPFYIECTIPANTYTNQAEDVRTVGINTVLIAEDDLSEELVYNITKTLFEQKAVIAETNIKAAELNEYSATAGVTIPFHPGAEKYLKETGAL